MAEEEEAGNLPPRPPPGNGGPAPGPPAGGNDVAARLRAARGMPVASAAELAAASAPVAGLPALGDVVQVKVTGGSPA